MVRSIGKLPAVSVSRLGPGYHCDGAGLWLQVTASGARSWIFRFTLHGKRREMGLGPTHTVGLAEAREGAKQARILVREGIDPIEARNERRHEEALSRSKALTFGQCCEQYIETHKASWKNAKHTSQWTNTLKTYCASIYGTPVASIGQGEVLACLEPIWKDKTETATRLRGRMESVLDWATVREYRSGDNPARWKGHLDHLLPTISKTKRVKHHKALPWKEIGAFMADLRKAEGFSARALEFLILTACRSSEVRGATWQEIDFKAKMWTIPPERMKMGKEHRVPLSDAAITLLKALPKIKDVPYVFPAAKVGAMLSDMAMTAALRRMEVDAVPHGFRSTFRDWAGESTNFPREVCEHALAHRLADGVEAAYQRGDMLQKRVAMMKEWADFCGKENLPKPTISDFFGRLPIQSNLDRNK